MFVFCVSVISFNPCYNGSGVRSGGCNLFNNKTKRVSILVIMEVG